MRWVLFSEQCRREDHQHCSGKNEFAINMQQDWRPGVVHLDQGYFPEDNRLPRHCFCSCHKHSEPPPVRDDYTHSRNLKETAEAFIKAYSGPVYQEARRAGLTEPQARRVAEEVMACVSRQLGREILDEISFRAWLQQIIQREIAGELGSKGETPDPPGP
jgi:hypothetical protein